MIIDPDCQKCESINLTLNLIKTCPNFIYIYRETLVAVVNRNQGNPTDSSSGLSPDVDRKMAWRDIFHAIST